MTIETMMLTDATHEGYERACRPSGVTRDELVTELDSKIGWRKYFRRWSERDGLQLFVTKIPGLPVLYFVR